MKHLLACWSHFSPFLHFLSVSGRSFAAETSYFFYFSINFKASLPASFAFFICPLHFSAWSICFFSRLAALFFRSAFSFSTAAISFCSYAFSFLASLVLQLAIFCSSEFSFFTFSSSFFSRKLPCLGSFLHGGKHLQVSSSRLQPGVKHFLPPQGSA